MSGYTSLPTHSLGYDSLTWNQLDFSDFEISDFLIPEVDSNEGSTSSLFECATSNHVSGEQLADSLEENGDDNQLISIERRREGKKPKADNVSRVAFRTKSELEVMDDGYKWRKYGKKSVKNTPFPRNYYRCSQQGCRVKKRVERDREDSSYVITTYDGMHTHESPSIIYLNEVPLMVPSGWTLQPSQSHST
ncbi:WRKY Transcription Factor [Ranunculus cassubicifolius]